MRGRLARLLVLAAAGAVLIAPGAAQAVTPSVVNTSTWLLTDAAQGKTDCAASNCANDANNRIRMMFVVRHDPGVSVTNLIVDKDWDSTNDLECGCSSNTTQTPTINKQTVVGGAIYSHVELNYDFSDHTSGTGMSDGATAVSKNIFVKVNVSSGTDPVEQDTVRFFDATNNSGESYGYFYNRSQSSTGRIDPGDSITYTFSGDDPDGGGPNDGSDWGGYVYRVRRINSTGSSTTTTANTTVCFNARSDGDQKTRTITFPDRGYYIVEAYALNSDGTSNTNPPCHDDKSFTTSYWILGDAEVNSTNGSLSGDLSVPAKVAFNSANAGTAQLTNLDDTDTGGVIQNVEWDVNGNTGDGEGGFEEVTLSDAPGTGLTSDSETIDSTGKAEGATIGVRARITDNGAVNGTDLRRAVLTLPTQNTVVNTRPVPTAQTVEVDADSADNPITLTGTDADSDPLTFTTVGAPSHGTLGGSGAARTYTPAAGYAGLDSFTFRANDGQNDSAGTATVTVRVRPDTEIFVAPASLSNDPDPELRFKSDLSLPPSSTLGFECKLSTEADFSDCSSPKDYTGLPDGDYTFEVRAIVDPGGVTDATPATHAWTIDATPPDTQIDAAPPALTNSTSAAFEFSSPDDPAAGFECRLDGAATFTACDSGASYDSLSPGGHTFRVRAKDAAGNVDADPAVHTWTVDTSPPNTQITANPADPTNQTTASFSYEVTPASQGDGTFTCTIDGGAPTPCGGPAASASSSHPGLAPGPHTFTVFATDAAGNPDTSPASYTWVVDTTPPEVTITDRPGDPTNETTADFEFSADEAGTFVCSIDGAAFAACDPPSSGTTGSEGYAGLDEGAHFFEVKSTDAAGNTSSVARYDWTVDLTPPFTSITKQPDDPSNDTTPEFEFSSEPGSTFECRLDSNDPGDFDPCSSPHEVTPPLGETTHRFEVRATDPAGNLGSAASHQWTVDTTPPEVAVDTGPGDPTNSTTADVTFSADEEGDFECRLDGGGFADCGTGDSGSASYPGPLGAGPHSFHVKSTDAAGNTSTEAVHQWTVDLTPPTATIVQKPDDPTNQTTATFTYTSSEDPDVTFACSLDGGAASDCTPGQTRQYTGLGQGLRSFTVTPTDAAGNTGDPVQYGWTIDTEAPVPDITSGPPAATNQTDASIEFSVSGSPVDVECDIDGGGFADCTSPVPYSGLNEGPHTVTVRGTDAAGNAGTDTHSWTVDTGPPDTAIDSGPPATSADSTAAFAFSSDETGSTFECRLDSAAWQLCTSPQAYQGLSQGSHTFDVRATDAAGNVDASPASATWTVSQQGVLGAGAGSPVIKRRIRALNVPNETLFQVATISCRARSCKVTRRDARIKIGGEVFKPAVTVEVVAKESAESLEKGEIARVLVHFDPVVKRALAAQKYGQLIVKLAAESSNGTASSFKKIRLKAKWLKKLVG